MLKMLNLGKKTKMVKITVIMALTLALTLFLLACGGNGADSEDSAVNISVDASAGESADNSPDDNVNLPESQNTGEIGNEVVPENGKQEEAREKVKSDGYEKFSQLEIGMTESEVNAILGEPVKVDKAYYYYNITVNGQDLELTVWINTVSGLVTYIYGNFHGNDYRAEFADSKVDLSNVDGLESGEIDTYDACVSAFKTPGYLCGIEEDGDTRYFWVNEYEGYMTVEFRADGTIKSYSGFC